MWTVEPGLPPHARKALLSRIGQSVILSRSLSLIFSDLPCLLLPLYDLSVPDHGPSPDLARPKALTA